MRASSRIGTQLVHSVDVVLRGLWSRALLCGVIAPVWAYSAETADLPRVPSAEEGTAPADTTDRAPHDVRTAVFLGRELSYVVVDGMAVHAGDMVLGPASDIEAASASPGLSDPSGPLMPARRDLAPASSDQLWPNATVPYVIDDDLSDWQRQNVESAIAEWNDKTIISLVARTAEANYVRFRNIAVGNCRSRVGMVGGEQVIGLPPTGCSANAVTHEIGHAVGLWHEHQRVDRWKYVSIDVGNLDRSLDDWFKAEHPGSDFYDFASVMHYGALTATANGGFVMETIPPGIDIPAAGLSAGDIDGVARLYGQVPERITISSNPPGLDILVDKLRYTTPVSFDWPDRSIHTIEPPVSVVKGGTRYLFGRWNTGGNRLRYVIAGQVGTWLEANFIVQHRVEIEARPPDVGEVVVTPRSPDGYYTLRTPMRAEAKADPSGEYQFWQWGSTLHGEHGRSSNPATWAVDRPEKHFHAYFLDHPLVRITSNVDPFVVYIDGEMRLGPVALSPRDRSDPVELRIDEIRPAPGPGLLRHRFESWRNGGAISQKTVLPTQGGEIRAEIVPEVPLSVAVAQPGTGTVTVEPASVDGYYPKGTPVRVMARPSSGWTFAGWIGEIGSVDPAAQVEMVRPIHLKASFSLVGSLQVEEEDLLDEPFLDQGLTGSERTAVDSWPPSEATENRFRLETPISDELVERFVDAGQLTLVQQTAADPAARTSDRGFRSRVLAYSDHGGASEAGSGTRATVTALASPRAQTFVSSLGYDPEPQVVELVNHSQGQTRFVVESDRPWLFAYPSQGTLASGESAQIAVSVSSVGIPPETYHGQLVIQQIPAESGGAGVAGTVNVTFVSVPSGRGSLGETQ